MTVLVYLGVVVLGGVGSLARFMLDGVVSDRVDSEFPWGTFAVNITGAFLLGLLAGLALKGDALRLAEVALLGSYTTFSTWLFESHRLGEQRQHRTLALNIVGSLAIGVAAGALGRLIGGGL